MARSDSTSAPSDFDVTTLGFVREVFGLIEGAGAIPEVKFNDEGASFTIYFSGVDAAAVAAIRRSFRGFPRPSWGPSWDVPVSVEHLDGGSIERQRLADNTFEVERTAYWGFPDDLVRAGVAPAAHVDRPARRRTKGKDSGLTTWRSYFAPSGRVLYYTSTEGYGPSIESSRRDAAIRTAIDRGEDLGVIRRDEDAYTVWIGTKADLIAANVCGEDHFPVAPKRQAYGSADGREHVESWDTYAIRRGYFEHRVHWDEETRSRRRQQSIAERKIEVDPDAFADHCELWMMQLSEHLLKMISGKFHTAQYDRETIAKVGATIEHARQVLQSSPPVAVTAPARSSAADVDPRFARFMAATLIPAMPDRRATRERKTGR